MEYIVKVDNREKDLIKILETKGHTFVYENLDLGDIQFIDNITKEIIIIIERKTYADLSSSIKDGRYKEQKERLLHSIKNNVRKIVLLEGNDLTTFTLSHKTFDSVIINTLIRDNIHIYMSKSKDDTIIFIENIMQNLPKYYDNLKKEIIENELKTFNNTCKIIKKNNITYSICFRNMLSQIPGVSLTIANVYSEKYINMANFIIKLKEETRDKAIEIISEEKHGTSKRRVGLKVGEKIYNFMFGLEE